MVIKVCLKCEKEFESNIIRQKYCSRKCNSRNYYEKHREELIRKTKEYDEKHPEQVRKRNIKKLRKIYATGRFKVYMKKNYENNKDKWRSRRMTYYLLNKSYYDECHKTLKKKCKCGSEKDIEIHHEEYPIEIQDIIAAINNGKIYYMCRKCHKHKDTHKP